MRAFARAWLAAILTPWCVVAQVAPGEWAAYGRDPFGTRYSPLTQITRENVSRLTATWTYRTGDTATTRRPAKFEATPLMVDGTLYLSTPFGRAIALDPTTGRERWAYDAHVDRNGNWGDFANRGVSTWVDSRLPNGARCKRRIFLTTIDARIVALDAARGTPCAAFGKNVSANVFEVHIERLHVEEGLLAGDGPRPRIDPTRWRPLIMSFCRFFGLGPEVHPSRLAESRFMTFVQGGPALPARG